MKNERIALLKKRLRTFWHDVRTARGHATDEILKTKYCALANESGLTAALGRFGEEDIRHVVNWALRGWNPFEAGPLHGEPR